MQDDEEPQRRIHGFVPQKLQNYYFNKENQLLNHVFHSRLGYVGIRIQHIRLSFECFRG